MHGTKRCVVLDIRFLCHNFPQTRVFPGDSDLHYRSLSLEEIVIMKLKRIPDQSHETIEETYQDIALNGGTGWKEIGQMMLRLVQYLEDHNIGADVWAGTSLADLIFSHLYDKKGSAAKVYAMNETYHIEYSIPSKKEGTEYVRYFEETDDVVQAAQKLQKIFSLWT